jgi:hypothetical protein
VSLNPHAWEIESATGCRWTVWNREDADAEAEDGHSVMPLFTDTGTRAVLTPSDLDMMRVIEIEMQQPKMLRVFPEKERMADLLLRLLRPQPNECYPLQAAPSPRGGR